MRTDKFDYDFDTFFALIFYDLLLSVFAIFDQFSAKRAIVAI